MTGRCDLCGTESDRLLKVRESFGDLGVDAICESATECASVWGEGFMVDPNETAVLDYSLVLLTEADKELP